MNKKVLDRINAIADIYTTSNREQKAVEELIELLNALMHRDKLNTLEEFADVIITMIQVLKKYDLKLDSLDRWIEYKVSRTEKRIESNEWYTNYRWSYWRVKS